MFLHTKKMDHGFWDQGRAFYTLFFSCIFTHASSYCFQRVLAIAILSVRLSCLSVTRVDQSKTVQARITKSSPLAAWKTIVLETLKLFHKFEGVIPN